MLVILSAILWAPVPNPGKFFGQVVTIFHSLFFFIVLVESAGLSGEPPLLQAEIKPAAATKLVACKIFLLEIFLSGIFFS